MKREVLWFLAVGITGFAVDAGLTQLLVKEAGLHPVAARIPAITLAVMVTFALNKHITFRAKEQGLLRPLLAYAAAQSVSQSLNFCVFSFMVFLFPLFTDVPALAVGAGSAAAMTVTFLLSKFWVFKPQ